MIRIYLLVFILMFCSTKAAVAMELTGEITAINREQISLLCGDLECSFPIAEGAKFFCNGFSTDYSALLPVTSEAFFEGKLLLNEIGKVVCVEGCYVGLECVVKRFFYTSENVYIFLQSLEDKRIILSITPLKEFPINHSKMYANMGMFVLFNNEGGIRKIFD